MGYNSDLTLLPLAPFDGTGSERLLHSKKFCVKFNIFHMSQFIHSNVNLTEGKYVNKQVVCLKINTKVRLNFIWNMFKN